MRRKIMKKLKSIQAIFAIAALVLATLACSLNLPGSSAAAPVEQWATSGTASSEYGTSNWSAQQATGAPNTTECGDEITAWASSSSSTVEWIDLAYTTPVYATKLVIYVSYHPSYVTQVELGDASGIYHTVYRGDPQQQPTCPYQMIVSIPKTDYLVTNVKISIDQTSLGSWSEIDAVQLVGVPK
jgi:hypothetical protein